MYHPLCKDRDKERRGRVKFVEGVALYKKILGDGGGYKGSRKGVLGSHEPRRVTRRTLVRGRKQL